MINTHLENDKAVYHITTSRLQYRYKYSCKKFDFDDAQSCQGSAAGWFTWPWQRLL